MLPVIFSHPLILAEGLIAGFILGFLFQKSQLPQFKTIVGQFLLRDFTMTRVILTAIAVGTVGIYGMLWLDLPVDFHIKGISMMGVVIGATLVGIGVSILGYCPTTCVAAAGQGCRDAWWGLLGMLGGAWAYAEMDEFFQGNILTMGKIENTTLQDFFNVSPWVIIAIIIVFSILVLTLLRFIKPAAPRVATPPVPTAPPIPPTRPTPPQGPENPSE